MKHKKLKIAVVSNGASFPFNKKNRFFTPLKVALDIAEMMAKKGHEVTFFAPKGSHSNIFKTHIVPVESFYKQESLLNMDDVEDESLKIKDRENVSFLLQQYFLLFVLQECQKSNFDILHIHRQNESLPMIHMSKITIPIVHTVHEALFNWRREMFQKFQTKNQHFISISKFQQKRSSKVNWVANIHNGVDVNEFTFHRKAGNQMAFAGRLRPWKGIAEAIKIALKTKKPLMIAGPQDKGGFWDKEISPHLGKNNITYEGFIPFSELNQYYGKSKVLLCPILWDEPFGMTFIESMACGTPVIAFARGSVPEVIKDGETGFIIN